MRRIVAVSVVAAIFTILPASAAGARTWVNADNGWCREFQAAIGTGVSWRAHGHSADHNGDGIVCHSFMKNGRTLVIDNMRH